MRRRLGSLQAPRCCWNHCSKPKSAPLPVLGLSRLGLLNVSFSLGWPGVPAVKGVSAPDANSVEPSPVDWSSKLANSGWSSVSLRSSAKHLFCDIISIRDSIKKRIQTHFDIIGILEQDTAILVVGAGILAKQVDVIAERL